MKLMKHITIALVLSVIPAMAFGQVGAIDAAMVDILCPADECHTATYFQGSGGFVGMATADDEDTEKVDESEVAFIVSCGNVTTRAVAEKDDMGVVRQVFSEDNGLACAAGGKIDIHRLMPGGWYWINDDMNSAVASLMPKTVLGNSQVAPLDPGGLTVSAGDNATYVKHEMSGRVGILQHIVPVPPVDGCAGAANAASSCVLGAASDWTIDLTAPFGVGGAAVKINGATVKRPGAAAMPNTYNVTATLKGSNFILIGDAPTATAAVEGAHLGGQSFAPAPAMVGTGFSEAGAMAAGVRSWSIVVNNDDEDRCADTNPDRDISQTVIIRVTSALTDALPAFAAGKGPLAAFSVTCPDLLPAAAQQGQELVPDNPFPVE